MSIKNIFDTAKVLQQAIDKLPGIIPSKQVSTAKKIPPDLEQVVTDPELYKAISKLFHDGHHAQAVEKAYKFLNNLVKRTSGSSEDGAKLMRTVFTANNPILKINAFSTKSETDEQLGYMEIFAGVMIGVRNPRSHEHDWEDTEERAIQLLSLVNHLVQKVRHSTK